MPNAPEPAPLPVARMVFHAALAGAFFFVLNRYGLDQPLVLSVVWGLVAAPGAAYLVWQQARR